MEKKNIAIFGVGSLADCLYFSLIGHPTDHVHCFISDIPSSEIYKGLPHLAYDEFIKSNLKDDLYIFVAVGPSNMNQGRRKVYHRFKAMGYKFYSYIGINSNYPMVVGENCFISQTASVGHNVIIENGVFIWDQVVISHDSVVKDFAYISPGACIGSYCIIESHAILGMSSIVKPQIIVAEKTLVGAGAYINSNTRSEGVYVPPASKFIGCYSTRIEISK